MRFPSRRVSTSSRSQVGSWTPEPEFSTLHAIAQWRGAHQPNGLAYTYLVDGEDQEQNFTYAELDRQARRIAVRLQQLDAVGKRALLLYEPGLDYIAAFYGCLYAGIIAVPAYPPDPMRIERTLPRLMAIVNDAQASLVLGTASSLTWVRPLFSGQCTVEVLLATDTLPSGDENRYIPPAIDGADIAFLQYTSGSTTLPRGVMVTHSNLLANVAAIECNRSAGVIGVTWLPMYHDFGLIGAVVLPMYSGARTISMSPLAFVQRPVRWLQAITKYRGTIVGGPNFGYDLCVRKITDEECASLDLSSLSIALNGAEPIRGETLERFSRRFAPYGFRPNAFVPCYGLAEATLGVTGTTDLPMNGPVIKHFERFPLEQHKAVESSGDGCPSRALVSSGAALKRTEVFIVDPATCRQLPEGEVGEIWVRSPSVARGYWGRPELTKEMFNARTSDTGLGPCLRTGDLGFRHEGELYVTGRHKDLLILWGQNHYPQDIEATVSAVHPALNEHGSAAFAIEADGQEQLVVVQEVKRPKKCDLDALQSAIREAILRDHGISALAIVLIKSSTLPKTSSGKVQRSACRDDYREGRLQIVSQGHVNGTGPHNGWTQASGNGFAHEPTNGASQAQHGGSAHTYGSARGPTNGDAHVPAQSTAPTTVTEGRLIALWREVLCVQEVDVEENFFASGGQSLLAVQLMARIQDEFEIQLPLGLLFANPTLESLAAEIDRIGAAGEPASEEPLARANHDGTLPLSPGQLRLWFVEQWAAAGALNHVCVAMRLPNMPNVTAVEEALADLVGRHESLRTTFELGRDGPMQKITATVGRPQVAVIEVSAASPGEFKQKFDQHCVELAQQPFELAAGPLWRLTLIRNGYEQVLVLAMHHLVTDGWSVGVLFEELLDCYMSRNAGREPSYSGQRFQYGDFSQWQTSALAAGSRAADLDYWRGQLAGVPDQLTLPTDRPRPAQPTFRGAVERVTFGADLSRSLATLAQQEKATLFMTLLAGFQSVLARQSGQTDILVGTAVANRPRREFERVIGFCVNSLVLRGDLSGDPTFRELLSRARQTTLAALEHQSLPFEKLVKELDPRRDMTHSPFFQVSFVLQNSPHAALPLGVQVAELPTGASKYDLTLSMIETATGLEGNLEYSTELFDAATVQRFANQFKILLVAAAENPDTHLSRLPLLSEDERQTLLAFGKGPCESIAAAPTTVVELFEARAALRPSATAVEDSRGSLAYGELNARANQLAHWLVARGSRPEAPVGICLERGTEAIVAMLGIWKAGGAYVPLDPEYPPARLEFMVEDSGLEVLLTESSLVDRLPALQAKSAICLDKLSAALSSQPTDSPRVSIRPEHLAYIIYTSGSTGRPKGVLLEHVGLADRMVTMTDVFGLDAESRILQFASLGFDASIGEIVPSLLAGATVCVATSDVQLPGIDLHRYLQERRISVATLPPTVLAATPSDKLPELRTIASVAETCPAKLVDRWAPGRRFLNAYGPTECTMCATFGAFAAGNGRPTIGRPLRNVEAYVLDSRHELVPIGVPGELYLGGVGVARGYLNQSGLTREHFIPHPFRPESGERIYRSGDVARWLADGQLEFLGRQDDQVKIRGFRIELGEVEAALASHPDVRQVVVVARDDGHGKQLVAYIVPQEVVVPRIDEVRGFLETRLPRYMLPAAVVSMNEFPLSTSGKVDRRLLPAPSQARPDLGHEYEAPRNDAEVRLAAIWQGVLGRERIGIWDNFFELGGDSILAIQVVSQARTAGLELTPRDLFERSTIARLAEVAHQELPLATPLPPLGGLDEATLRRLAVPGTEIEDVYPLAPLQTGFLFHAWFAPESQHFVQQASCTFEGQLRPEALQGAWEQVVARHAILRTRFVWEGLAEPLQIVDRGVILPWVNLDWQDVAIDEHAQRWEGLLAGERGRGFRLDQAPLLRFTLVQTAPNRWRFIWTHHHLVLDGWSLPLVLQEVVAEYEAIQSGQTIEHVPPRPYRDYIAWLANQDPAEGREFWRDELRDFAAAGPLVFARTIAAPTGVAGNEDFLEQSIPFSASLTNAAQQFSRQHRVTVGTLLQAAWALVLARTSGSDDVLFGLTTSGRSARLQGIETMVGLLINTVPARVRLPGEQSVLEWLAELQLHQAHVRQFEHVPLAAMQGYSAVPRGEALFESIMIFENQPLPDGIHASTGAFQVHDVHLRQRTNYPLSIVAMPGDRINVQWLYDRRRFDAETIERVGNYLAVALESLIADPMAALASVSILSADERRKVLEDFSGARRLDELESFPTPPDLVQQLFERQAAERPTAPALVFEEEAWTYAALNAAANQLAHYLRQKGVEPESRIGICLERGPRLIVAILGVLKAGGAFVPLDAEYPSERLAFFVADARLSVLLTEESLLDRLPLCDALVVALDNEAPQIAQQPVENPFCRTQPEDLAYVIYTSGSTGRPKGVMIEHRNWSHLLDYMRAELSLFREDCVLQFASPSFDVSIWELSLAWIAGARLCLARAESLLPGQPLVELLERHAVTVVTLSPTALLILPEAKLDCLRMIFTVGESCPAEVVHRWATPGRLLINGYGPTETTVIVTLGTLQPDDQPPPIGRPVLGTEMFVLDQRRQPVPVDVPGELYIGGHGVGRGYLERRELTAERYVSHPFRKDVQARLYRSGDLVRWRANGELECLGRLDYQVKIRGFRIELGEIEAALDAHPQVRQAIVVARDDGHGKQLVAYVVPKGDAAPRIDELQTFLQIRLPRYMLPAALVTLSQFPLTTSGKVDRRSLPAPSSDRPDLAQDYQAPRTELETHLVAIWQTVLGREQIGIGDNFFELGGDSILAIQVVAQARSAGLQLLPRQLFERPTIAQLAEAAGQEHTILAEQGVVTGAAPLVPIARWYFQQQQPEPQHFNQALLLTSRERLDRSALERALPILLRHHDALRLRYERTAGGWQMEFAPLVPATVDRMLDCVNLQLDTAATEAAWQAAAAQAQKSLDLGAGRLVRFLIGDTGGTSDRLLVIIHHLAVDGVSWRILVEDLISAYEQSRAGLAVQLPDKTSSYRDWSSWLAEYAKGETLLAELPYWRQVVAPGLVALPGNAAADAGTAGEAKTFELALDSELTQRLVREAPVAHRASVEEFLLAALSLALGQWSPEGSLLVDLEGHGREGLFNDLDVSRTSGWFTSLYPLRLCLNAQRAPVDVLADVKRLCRAVPQRGIGFGMLRYLAGASELAEVPTADISFNYLGQLDTAIAAQSGWTWSLEGTGPSRSPAHHRSHAMTVSAAIVGGRLQAAFEFNPARHAPEVIERLGASFLGALEGLLGASPAIEVQATSDSSAPNESKAAVSKNEGAGETSVLVPIRATGDRPPLFCVHPIGGTVFSYYSLAHHLGSQQPFYGIQARGLGGGTPTATVEALASEYCAAMRSVQRMGPYFLAGWSLGGFVAYEMARQFLLAGDEVGLVAVFDIFVDEGGAAIGREEGMAGFLRLIPEAEPISYDEFQNLPQEQRLAWFQQQMEVAGLVAPGTPPQEVRGMLAVFEANIQAGFSYRPEPAPVRLALLRATHGIGQDRSDPFLGWEALTAKAEVQLVPGNHLTMVREPNVRELAEQLRDCLERAYQASRR